MVIAANDLPSINDITYRELVEIIAKVPFLLTYYTFLLVLNTKTYLRLNEIFTYFHQLKDENGLLMGVDMSGLLITNSGNDLPVSIKSPLFFLS